MLGCKGNINDDNTSLVDSVTTVKNDSNTQSFIIEKVDADFIAEAIRFNKEALELGKLARQNGNYKRIKTFGMVLINDQSKINKKIKILSSVKNIPPQVSNDDVNQDRLTVLKKKSGDDFDKAYIVSINNEYKKEIEIFEAASKNCADPDIKLFAAKTLPRLKTHLDAINAISYSMK
jgi:putative membrane protein